MKQRVLVLGATGFIGKRVVEALATSDWATPIAASRRLVTETTTAVVERQQLDATDARQMARAIHGVAAIVNCVAGDARTIVSSAQALCGIAAKQVNQPRIVHLSSVAVYGSAVGNLDESAPLRRDLSAYGSAKIDAEQQIGKCQSVVTFRPGIVYGPGSVQWSDRIGEMLLARRLGDLGATGDGYCNLIYVDDLVTAILQAIRLPGIEGHQFNLGMAFPPTWNEYFSMYAIALGAVPVRRIPRRRLFIEAMILAPPLKIAEIVARRIGFRSSALAIAITPSLLRLWSQELRMDVSKARSFLSVNWTPLEIGLRKTASWFLSRLVGSSIAPK